MYNNNNIVGKKSQEKIKHEVVKIKGKYTNNEITAMELVDINSRGKRIDWAGKKMANEMLANVYDCINTDKSERLRKCATYLEFKIYEDGTKKLHNMASCRVRLCPICSWRRSRKVFSNTMKVVNKVNEIGGYSYIFLTLTVKNVKEDKLDETLDNMMRAWDALMHLKDVKKAVQGWLRCLEVNHDTYEVITPKMYQKSKKHYDKIGLKVGDNNPNFNYYHPHFHVLICVKDSYFKTKDYIRHDKWQEIWRNCLNVDYLPEINIKRCYGTDVHAVSECSKYSTKSKDYIIPDDFNLSVNTVRTLDACFHHRRLVAYGGLFKKIKAQLKLEDEETGDLIHIDEDGEFTPEKHFVLQSYFWYSGYSNYYTKID